MKKIIVLINNNVWLRQFIKFGIVGVSNTVIGYLLNVGALWLLKSLTWRFDYVAANIISWLLSVLWSYYWNNRFVFTALEGQERTWWKVLLKSYASYALTGLVICNVLSYLWVDIFGVSKYIAPLINLVISVPLNFVMNKLWAYRA